MDRLYLFLKYRKTSLTFLILAIVYTAQSIFYKPSLSTTSAYHVDTVGGHILMVSMLIPSLITWFLSLFAYLSFRSYAESLRKTKDWEAHKYITTGLLWLACFSPVSSILTEFNAYVSYTYPRHTAQIALFTVYASLFTAVVASIYLLIGSEKLSRQLKGSVRQPHTFIIVGFLALATIYVNVRFKTLPFTQTATSQLLPSVLYGPYWLVLCTVIIPRIILWYLFLSAILNFYDYASRVNGIFYRSAFMSFTRGQVFALGGVIIIRLVQSLPIQTYRYGPELLLITSFVLLLIINIGFILMANGSSRLKSLEKL